MASRKFIQAQMTRLENNYGKERFKVTQPMFEVWADMLGELNEDGIKASVEEYIRTNEYPPNVASILKIYNAKSQYREEIRKHLLSKYAWIAKWYEEPRNNETYKLLIDFISKYPASQRIKCIDDLTLAAIQYYNDCMEKGLSGMTIAEFLEGYTWTRKDK